MIKTYGLYSDELGITVEIVEFTNKEDAEKAKDYLEKKYGGKYIVNEESVFESFEEFLKVTLEYKKGGE